MTKNKGLASEFEAAYGSLNENQRQAVDAIDGPVMVIAGPGTGKTQILAIRIANILQKTDTKPENILALTFTDAGVHAMKERLRRFIGDASYRVAVHTFHSFAGLLIRQYPDAYPSIIGGRPASDMEKLSIVQSLIDNGEYRELRPHGDPLYYVKKIPGAIADLKKEYVTPDILAERITELENKLADEPKYHESGAHKGKVRGAYATEEKRIKKLRELNTVYRQYQAALRERRLFDFEDMIIETVAAMRSNEDMLFDLQETYQYILADEHQDVNEAQNKILELLASYHDRPNLFVVGDEKQAIYRFQGASLDNFLFFESRFNETKVISLTDNYRSTQNILDAAHSLVETDDEELSKLRVPLKAASDVAGTSPEFRQFAHEAVEDEWVIEQVKKAEVPLSEIAIIVRYNRDVEHFTSLLRRHGFDVNPSADSDILDHPITRAVENLMGAACKIDSASLFDVLLGGWWKIPAGDLARVFAAQSRSWPLYRLIADDKKLRELSIDDTSAIIRVNAVLEGARKKMLTEAPHLVLQYLIDESGLLEQVMKDDPLEGSRVLRRIYDEVESMVINDRQTSASAIAAELQYRRINDLPLIAPFIEHDKSAVQVTTAHKAKGLEFHTVIIPRANDDAFGKAVRKDLFKLPLLTHDPLPSFTPEDDERRLLYVAMTRAKQNLLLSSSETDRTGKLKEPSRFLSVIDANFLQSVPTEKEGDDFKPEELLTHSLPALKLDPSLIRDLFLTRGLSVTHLNNYLEDPWKYYYENLLRRPHPRSLALLRGEAVHEVLEKVTVMCVDNKVPSDTDISNYLKLALSKLPLSENDEVSLHEKTFSSLLVYLPHMTSQLNERSKTELSIKVVLETGDPELPEIPLTGKLDRVDRDEEGNAIRVVDYKTGKPKSRNEIEGLTKNGTGAYKRQLVFYALLLSLYEPERPLPKEFTLSFVEPKERSGEIVEHTFEISKAEVEELKKEVVRVAKEIVSGEKFS